MTTQIQAENADEVSNDEMGTRLRLIRKSRKLSLAEVASSMSMSVGYLSQIERGLSSPSLRMLSGLAQVYGISLPGMLADAAASSSNREDIDDIVQRRADHPHLDLWRTGIDKELFTPKSDSFVLDMYLMTIAPMGTSGDDFLVHSGEEVGVVLSGQFELQVGEKTWRLEPRDSFRFASTNPHRYRNLSVTTECKIMWSIYTPKDQQNIALGVSGDAGTTAKSSSPADGNSGLSF